MNMDRLNYRYWEHEVWNDPKTPLVPKYTNIVDGCDPTVAIGDFEFCTGLKDKNGNLIYEGDIVKGIATVDEGGFEYCGVVEWNDQSELIGWYIVDADGNGWELKQAHAKISSDNITGEIIGNIHEHKD